MSKNILFLIIIIVVVEVAIVGISLYYYSPQPQAVLENQSTAGNGNIPLTDEQRKTEYNKYVDENFPDVISGTLSLSTKNPTIKTIDNKEYVLWPIFLRVFYEENGFKDGQQVQFQGKILPIDAKINTTKERLSIPVSAITAQ